MRPIVVVPALVVDVRNFNANLRKLEKFCYQEKHFNIPVMQAIEQLGAGK